MFWLLPLAGAIGGALLNKDDPLKGALMGAGIGATGGAAAGALGAGAAGADRGLRPAIRQRAIPRPAIAHARRARPQPDHGN